MKSIIKFVIGAEKYNNDFLDKQQVASRLVLHRRYGYKQKYIHKIFININRKLLKTGVNKEKYFDSLGNLQVDSASGTHWVAYYKNKQHKEYFDSFGNLQPPLELVKYLGSNIEYNYKQHQKYNSFNCGHLCLKFLNEINNK